jgi:hypothetical protein
MVETTAVFLPAEPNFLPVGMAEGRVVDHDVFGGNTLGLEIGLEDLVGGARIDIISARQHPALHRAAIFAHQIVDSRNRLLVGRGTGIEDILRAFLTLILDRIKEQAIQLLEDRQHRFARH